MGALGLHKDPKEKNQKEPASHKMVVSLNEHLLYQPDLLSVQNSNQCTLATRCLLITGSSNLYPLPQTILSPVDTRRCHPAPCSGSGSPPAGHRPLSLHCGPAAPADAHPETPAPRKADRWRAERTPGPGVAATWRRSDVGGAGAGSWWKADAASPRQPRHHARHSHCDHRPDAAPAAGRGSGTGPGRAAAPCPCCGSGCGSDRLGPCRCPSRRAHPRGGRGPHPAPGSGSGCGSAACGARCCGCCPGRPRLRAAASTWRLGVVGRHVHMGGKGMRFEIACPQFW